MGDLTAAQQYLRNEVLAHRLIEITDAATRQLRQGVAPKVLFSSAGDAVKFHETMTFFAVAAVENGDFDQLNCFAEALKARRSNKLEPRTMSCITDLYGLP